MNCYRTFVAALLAVGLLASSASAAPMLLYEQTFNPPPGGQSGEILPWSVNMVGGFLGTFNYDFALPDVLRDANSGQPINGNTGVYTGIGDSVGGPGITNNMRLMYTVDGQADFETINPADCPDDLYLNVFANTQAGGADDFGYFVVQAGPGGRDPSQWYISKTPMAAPTVNEGTAMNLRSLLYNPAAGNWENLTVDTTNATAPVNTGGSPDLSGLLITGVGVLMSVTNPAPLEDFSNATAFSSWNFADYRITCGIVPEPSALLLLVLSIPAGLLVRRKK